MNSLQAKEIQITEYLASKNHVPVRHSNSHDWWYKSPFREEKTASFKVNTLKNLFFDFGTAEHGNIIDLALKLGNKTISEALQDISKTMGKSSFSFQKQEMPFIEKKYEYEIIKVQPLQNQALIDYASSRGICTELAKNYLQEIYYKTSSGKNAFACCMTNNLEGYVLRSKFVKLNLLKTSFTHIKGTNLQPWFLIVYEGIFSALSDLQMNGITGKVPYGILILNSCANVNQVEQTISQYEIINLRLDNDEMGKQTANKIIDMTRPNQLIFNTSYDYSAYNDLNDKLLNTLNKQSI